MLILDMLLDHLKGHVLRASLGGAGTDAPASVLLLDRAAGERGGLYVGAAAQAAELIGGMPAGRGFILFTAGDHPGLVDLERPDLSLVVTDLPLEDLHNQLVGYLAEMDQWRQALERSARKGIRCLLTELGELSGATVYALSAYGQAIATGPKGEQYQRMEALLGENLYIERKVLSDLFEGFREDRRETYLAAREDFHFCISPVLSGGQLLGHMLLGGLGDPGKLRTLNRLAADAMEGLLSRNGRPQESYVAFQALVQDMLSEDHGDLEELQLRLLQLPKRPRKYMRGILVRTPGRPADPESQLMGALEQLFRRDNVAVFEGDYYILASDPSNNFRLGADPKELEQLLERHDAYAIVANPSVRTRGLRVLYRQCRATLDIAVAVRYRTKDRCLFFERYAMYYAIHLCALSMKETTGTDDLVFLCHPGLLTLRRYDKAMRNNLQDVLFHYLMNDRSIARTAEALFLHRNTAIYKINKIEELMGTPLDDPYLRQQLLFSCLIVRYIECYEKREIALSPLERGKGNEPGYS